MEGQKKETALLDHLEGQKKETAEYNPFNLDVHGNILFHVTTIIENDQYNTYLNYISKYIYDIIDGAIVYNKNHEICQYNITMVDAKLFFDMYWKQFKVTYIKNEDIKEIVFTNKEIKPLEKINTKLKKINANSKCIKTLKTIHLCLKHYCLEIICSLYILYAIYATYKIITNKQIYNIDIIKYIFGLIKEILNVKYEIHHILQCIFS